MALQLERTSSDPAELQCKQITGLTVLTVRLIVEFTKQLPGFQDKLCRDDQICLVKVMLATRSRNGGGEGGGGGESEVSRDR